MITRAYSNRGVEDGSKRWGKVDAAQAQAVLGRVLAVVKGATHAGQLRALAQAVQALPVQLDGAQAQAALGPVLATIQGTTSPYELQALAEAVQAPPVQLDGAQAQAALGRVLDAIQGTTYSDELPPLGEAAQALAGKVDGAQAQAVLGPVLAAIQGTSDDEQLYTLAQAVQALAGKVDGAQAQAALGPVLAAIQDTFNSDQLQALAEAFKELAGKLNGAQAPSRTGPMKQGSPRWRSSTRWPRRCRRWRGRSTARRRRLHWLCVPVWPGRRLRRRPRAGVLVALLPREKPEICLAEIVEALKYPTSAGAATDVLLDALHGIDPNAPGKEAGLAANLAWLTTAYPAIDLDAPPLCPPPLLAQQDVTCPVRGA